MSVFIEAVQKPIKPENLPMKIPQRPSNMKNQQSNLVLVIFNYPPLINNFYLYRQLAQVTTKATRVVNSDTGWSYQMTTGIRQQCKYYHKHSAVNGTGTSRSCKDLF